LTAEPRSDADADADASLPAASPLKALLLAAFVVACVFAVYLTPLREAFTESGRDGLRRRLLELGDWAPWAFVALTAVGVAIGVPRLALAALGGILFDWALGAALSQIGAMIGCTATFAVARALGRDWLDARVRGRFPRAGRLLDFIGRHGFEASVLVRLVPVGNAFATSLLMAMSPVSVRTFLLGTFVGMLPETVIVAYGASAARGQDVGLRLTVSAVALAVLALGVWWWSRRVRRGTRRRQVSQERGKGRSS
jgi:uncharacterized membrane protein YdjX (TVP38/TMEM64 family)